MTVTASATTSVLAATTTGSDGAGLIAFVIVAGLFVACWFLYKSMRRQLGRIDVSRSAVPQPGVKRLSRSEEAVDGDQPPV